MDLRGPAGRYCAGGLKGGKPVAALARKTDGRLPTVWTGYFATCDAATLCARIRAAGGRIVSEPAPVGDLGTTALVTDPGRAVFALWQAAGASGFGRRREPGTFAWAQPYTRDTEIADTLYGDLFRDTLSGGDSPRPDFDPTSAGRRSPTSSRPGCRPTSSSTSP